MKITEKLKVVLKSLLDIKMGEVNTDKAVLVWDGEDELREGVEVFVRNEEGEVEPAADGEYVTEDNKTIVVVDGKVAEIKDPEAEVAPEAEVEAETETENVEMAEEEPEVEPADEPETNTEEASVEDRIAAVEERIQTIVDGINEIVNSIAALEARIAEAEEKLASVEAPAAEPIDEGKGEEVEQRRSRLSYLKRD